ncbi:MAG: hypothetical protein Q9190_002301 [Brigantiaea leucoxantha]
MFTNKCIIAAAPPQPKHFTDEELKQQYGIHLATRLQADGDGKEAKWADIDDDEDDWAPETIEWNDGTKITLASNDAAAIEAEEQAAAQAAKEKQEAEAKSKITPPKTTTSVGPNATVLRVGQSSQPKSTGSTLKVPAEKPTLVAKPSAPSPVKSPWASIPTVDKVPPVQINPPMQIPASRHQQADTQKSDIASPPPSAAMEIAADSFSRARRDTPNAPPGQLFNSQSGQYETVSTGRRGSVRKDQNFRPPSVLQRPSQSDQRGPAEPSAAFQTHRAGSQQEVGIWTRRGSSVSGDSGPYGRRTSMNKGTELPQIPDELLQQRRDSQPLQSPALPNGQSTDPGSASASPQQQRVSLMSTSAKGHTPDEIQAQKKIMLEKRELAAKRRQEEEARELAARMERIKILMEKQGLAPLPDKGSEKDGPAKKEEEKLQPDGEPTAREKDEATSDTPTLPVESDESKLAPPQSPPKPPVPDSSGEPKQYGMMKVHGPPLTNGIQYPHDNTAAEKARGPAASPPKSQIDDSFRPKSGEPSPAPMVNGTLERKPQPVISPDQRQDQIRVSKQQQPWSNIPKETDTYSGWNGAGMTTHSSSGSNLWAPPNNYKALGNGTFDRNVQRPQSGQSFYQDRLVSPAPPQPIGPPKPQQRSRPSPEATRPPETNTIPILEDVQTIPTFPPSEAPPKSQTLEQGSVNTQHRVQPQVGTAATSHSRISPERNDRGQDQISSTLAAWSNFHVADAERSRQAVEKHALKLAEDDRTLMGAMPQLAPMQETWRQVADSNGQRQVVGVSKRQTGAEIQPPQTNGDLRISSLTNGTNILPPSSASRGSRFFPAIGHNIQGHNQRAVSLPVGMKRFASPPPPDSRDHPAYARDNHARPLVKLPVSKPKPKVKLPPSFTTPAQSPIMSHVNVLPLRAVSQPLVNNPTWQDRFDGLLRENKKLSPETRFAEVVDFSVITKVPLEMPDRQPSASVALPPKAEESHLLGDRGKVSSKESEDEEALFENREFGSLPVVSIPAKAPDSVGFQEVAVKQRRSTRAALSKPLESESKQEIEFDMKDDQVAEGILIFIGLPGIAKKSKTILRTKGQGSHYGSQRLRHVSMNTKSTKTLKPREVSGNYNLKHPQTGPHKTSTHSIPGSQSRTQHRPKNDWYNRNPNVPTQNANLIPT